MKEFRAKVTDIFDIKGRSGTTVVLDWIERGSITPGDIIKSETGEEIVVIGIEMFSPHNDDMLAILVRSSFEEAQKLKGKVMTKLEKSVR